MPSYPINTTRLQLRPFKRLGMRREAHFIHNEIFKGEWGDEFVYALLVDEWNIQKGTDA